MNTRIHDYLVSIYGADGAAAVQPQLEALIDEFKGRIPSARRQGNSDEGDVILITYGDMVQADGERPLQTLYHFLQLRIGGLVSTVHLLPFFPYSSDDGFSVIDYDEVNPALGDWTDVEAFRRTFRLMFDAVVNHISQYSDWFQAFLDGEVPFSDYFIETEPSPELAAVFRPRALPLLKPVSTAHGDTHVWTTFSPDQIDLNFASPDLLLEIVRVLLNYVVYGAELIRLDAIAYIWKEAGTDCIHRPQTHALIKLMRSVLDEIAPQTSLITETNVPHADNISYFGNGRDEAQMVYNFSLPPLTLNAFHTGRASVLSEWADTLKLPSDQVTFLNFLASHDGIGLQPARGLLGDQEVEAMARRIEALGGFVSYKTDADGGQSAYELNCNFLDALGDPEQPHESFDTLAQRFLAAQAIMLVLQGVPGIYFHSLFGSQNWPEGVALTGHKRTINRQKLQRNRLEQELANPTSLRGRVFQGYYRLLELRRQEAAFQPQAAQHVHIVHEALFVLQRTAAGNQGDIYCVQNVSREHQMLILAVDGAFVDLIEGTRYQATEGQLIVPVAPYGICWLKTL